MVYKFIHTPLVFECDCHLSLGLEVPETVQEPPELAKLGIKDEVIK